MAIHSRLPFKASTPGRKRGWPLAIFWPPVGRYGPGRPRAPECTAAQVCQRDRKPVATL